VISESRVELLYVNDLRPDSSRYLDIGIAIFTQIVSTFSIRVSVENFVPGPTKSPTNASEADITPSIGEVIVVYSTSSSLFFSLCLADAVDAFAASY
jgi:hypothetical protein